ncbi:hypothetical protein AC423_001443 [Salmonella enterica subsp. enterica]|nr:hypothetical protein [Salmonella enterica subsp. enterica]
MSETKFYAILTDKGAALEAAALATGTPVTLNKFVIGDGGGSAVTPDPTRTALVREVYRGNIKSAEAKDNQVTFTLYIPPEVGGYTIREAGILAADGTLYSLSNSPDILKPTESNGAVISITFKYILAVSSTSTVTVVVYDDYLTPDVADQRYLQISKNLSEIAANGDAAKAAARTNIGIGGDIAYRDEKNTFTQENTFNSLVTHKRNIVLDGGNDLTIQDRKYTSGVIWRGDVNSTSNFRGSVIAAADHLQFKHKDNRARFYAAIDRLLLNDGTKDYKVYHEGNLKPVLKVNNVGPDTNGNVNVQSGDGGSSSKAPNGWRKNSDGTIHQWGTTSLHAMTTFPIPFPTLCASVVITYRDKTHDDAASVSNITTTSFMTDNEWAGSDTQLCWQADGY